MGREIRPSVSLILTGLPDGESAGPAIRESIAALDAITPSFEILLVVDGGVAGSGHLQSLAMALDEPRLMVRQRSRPGGERVVLKEALALSRGTVVVTFDASGGFAPAGIPELLQQIKRGADVVSARAERPADCCTRRGPVAALRFALLAMVSGLSGRDWSSGFRAYRRSAIDALVASPAITLELPDLLELRGFRSVGVRMPIRCGSKRPSALPGIDQLLAIVGFRFACLRRRIGSVAGSAGG